VSDRQHSIKIVSSDQAGCGQLNRSHLQILHDASTATDCDTNGGGDHAALCLCDAGTLRPAAGYEIRNGASAVVVGVSSVTLTAETISINGDATVAGDLSFSGDGLIDAGGDGSTLLFTSSGGGAVGSEVPWNIPAFAVLPACSGLAAAGNVALAWNATSGTLCACSGTSWVVVAPAGGGC